MYEQVTLIVASALGVDVSAVTADSSSGTLDAWDSLGHLAVLDGLDKAFPGITSTAPELGTAESVSEIVAILERHQ